MKIKEYGTVVFEQDDIENVLAKMDPEEIDGLAFGVIQLDEEGKILYYSVAEGRLANREPSQVVGKNFFNEVAPCSKRPEFYGRFLEGVKSGHLDVAFEYIFDYKMNPTRVRIRMKKAEKQGEYWLLVRRIGD
jgi:photoactive yellow protein